MPNARRQATGKGRRNQGRVNMSNLIKPVQKKIMMWRVDSI